MSETVLYDYWRSSASYRVRIALNIAGIAYKCIAVDLLKGEHMGAENRARNPQGLVPTLQIDGQTLTQSAAIIEYLNETRADLGFLPDDPLGRARVRQLAYVIAMEIHPVCNLSVSRYAIDNSNGGISNETWMPHFIDKGLSAFEVMLDHPSTGKFCHGDNVTLADMCLMPQVYNAKRWKVDMKQLPRVRRIADALSELPAFKKAAPVPPVG